MTELNTSTKKNKSQNKYVQDKAQAVVKEAYQVSRVSILANVILSILKLVAGVLGKSRAMISDSVHSLSDVFGSIIVVIGIKMSKKEPDEEHPYGHDKMECMASLILADILIVTGAMIIYEGISTICEHKVINIPRMIALIMAVVSIVIKEALFWYTLIVAKKISSDALKAEAWHHRSDAISSVGSLIGIGGAMLGHPILDTIMSIVIGVIILKIAFEIGFDSVNKLIDRSLDKEVVEKMSKTIKSVDGVIHIDIIRTRLFGTKAYVDVEISVNPDLLLKESHLIAEKVHNKIEYNFPEVKHCTVHVNPDGYMHEIIDEKNN